MLLCVCVLGHVWLCVAPWTVDRQGHCLRNFSGKNTGVRCHFLLQGIFLTQGLNPHLLRLLHWQADSWASVPPGTPNPDHSLWHLPSAFTCPHVGPCCMLTEQAFVDMLNNSWTITKSSCLVSVLPVCCMFSPWFLTNKSHYYVTPATFVDSPLLRTWSFLASAPTLGVYY